MISIYQVFQAIHQSLTSDDISMDTVKFLSFQLDCAHADLNNGQPLTDAQWAVNPNGTVYPIQPDKPAAPAAMRSSFIIPAEAPKVLRPGPETVLYPEQIALMNIFIDRYEAPNRSGAGLIITTPVEKSGSDLSTDLWVAVVRGNAFSIAMKENEPDENGHVVLDVEALHGQGVRFFDTENDVAEVGKLMALSEHQIYRDNRPVEEGRYDKVFRPRVPKDTPLFEPDADMLQQFAELGLVRK